MRYVVLEYAMQMDVCGVCLFAETRRVLLRRVWRTVVGRSAFAVADDEQRGANAIEG